jgi:hypothetical protein
MDILNLEFLGGFPLRQDRLKFLQDSIVTTFKHVSRGPRVFLAMNANTGQPLFGNAYILHGCEITDNGNNTITVTAGAIFQEDEVFQVSQHTISKSGAALVLYHFNAEINDDPEGIREYANGDSNPTQQFRRAKLAFTAYANNGQYLNDLVNLPFTKVVVNATTMIAPRFADTYGPWKIEVQMINGWQNSHDGNVKLFYHLDGKVHVLCNAIYQPSGALPTEEQFFTLPVGYRPATNVQFFMGVFNGFRIYVHYLTNGVVKFLDQNGEPASELSTQPFELNHWFETA